ncbi:MAG: hypothetical protein ACP5O2_10585 [Bacteroidales bacterium]
MEKDHAKALNYYHEAEDYADKANALAADAREYQQKYAQLNELLEKWDIIMRGNHPLIYTVIFVIVTIVEYLFSIDLYKDLLPQTPWIIPIGIAVVSVIFSHFIARMVSPSLRQKEFVEKRSNPFNEDKTDEELENKIKLNSYFWGVISIIGAVFITYVIYRLSKERVDREIAAHMRKEPFGIYDLLPVIFYVAEVIFGFYVLYILNRLGKSIQHKRWKTKFDTALESMVENTRKAVSHFSKAEEHGYNILTDTVSQSLHMAFYRNKRCNPSDELEYIAEPEMEEHTFLLQLRRDDPNETKQATIHIHTEYNYTATAASDVEGKAEFRFKSFPHDLIRRVEAEFMDGANGADDVNLTTNQKNYHMLIFRV